MIQQGIVETSMLVDYAKKRMRALEVSSRFSSLAISTIQSGFLKSLLLVAKLDYCLSIKDVSGSQGFDMFGTRIQIENIVNNPV